MIKGLLRNLVEEFSPRNTLRVSRRELEAFGTWRSSNTWVMGDLGVSKNFSGTLF